MERGFFIRKTKSTLITWHQTLHSKYKQSPLICLYVHQIAEKSLIKQGEKIETHLQTSHHHLVPTI